jgi:glycosyltransferase involved in cell wall biosynthesis
MRILVSSLVDLQKSAHNSRLHQFLRYLSHDHDITVLCLNDWWKAKWEKEGQKYNESFRELFDKIDILYISDRKVSPIVQDALSLVTVGTVLKSIDASDFDVHFSYNNILSGYAITQYTSVHGVPTVFDIADDLIEMVRTSPQIAPFMRPVGGMISKAIICKNIRNSQKVTVTAESLSTTYGIPRKKVELLPNGVDVDMFSPRPCDYIRSAYGLENCFVVGHVGVLREWLDLRPLFIAIKRMAQFTNIKLLIVGGGVGYEGTVEMAKEIGIMEHTIFTGTVPYPQVSEFISCMDVGVVPFKQDGVSNNSLPLKLFEYFACGVPVISTRIDVIRKMFGHHVLFVSGPSEYVQMLLMLYKNPDLRREMGISGRKIVERDYQWSILSKKLETIMQSVADDG